MKRGVWGSRLGFYMAAIGSAFGLGGLWRFPYVAQENGGGAFVVIYFALIALIGVPLLIGELILGKSTKRSLISALRQVRAHQAAESGGGKKRFPGWLSNVGLISVLVGLLILSYYSVISGWVLHYSIHFISANVSPSSVQIINLMSVLQNKGWLQVLLTSAHLLLVIVVVAKEFEDGLERFIGYVMPVFAFALLLLMMRSLSLESAPDALRFLLYPDFTRLKLESLGAAVGQLCFTLSIGFGTMVTFGSYLRDEVPVAATGFRVTIFDSIATMMAGVLLFPLVFNSPLKASGPELLFQTVPAFLVGIDGGAVFGLVFFVCLYLAAFGASLSLLEGVVANLTDTLNIGRGRAAWVIGGIAFLLSLFPALSSTFFESINIRGKGLLEVIDIVLINWIVPILALVLSQVVRFRLNENIRRGEFIVEDNSSSRILYSHWSFLMKWVVPPVIGLGLLFQIVALFIKS